MFEVFVGEISVLRYPEPKISVSLYVVVDGVVRILFRAGAKTTVLFCLNLHKTCNLVQKRLTANYLKKHKRLIFI